MNEEQRQQVAARIRALMQERHWSQAALAKEAQVSENTVSKLLRGEPTRAGTLRKVLGILEVPPPQNGLDLDSLPEDVRAFTLVATKRLAAMSRERRSEALSSLYRVILEHTD